MVLRILKQEVLLAQACLAVPKEQVRVGGISRGEIKGCQLGILNNCYSAICCINSTFVHLTAEVLSEEPILKWYKDAHLAKGKSVFLEQMKKFVEWLKNAEEGNQTSQTLPFPFGMLGVKSALLCGVGMLTDPLGGVSPLLARKAPWCSHCGLVAVVQDTGDWGGADLQAAC